MKVQYFFAVIAVALASFIQTGCGTANPANTVGYNQCQIGFSMVNGQCQPASNYNNGYNNGYPNTGTCAMGPSYPFQGSCSAGYIQSGNMCACQSNTNSYPNGNTGSQYGQCQLPNGQGWGFYVQGTCAPQGPCMQGYAYVAPYCYRVQ